MKIITKVQKDINKVQNKLIARCKKRGIYENFGQKEVRELRDKWIDIGCYTKEMNQIKELIQEFDNWCMRYNG